MPRRDRVVKLHRLVNLCGQGLLLSLVVLVLVLLAIIITA